MKELLTEPLILVPFIMLVTAILTIAVPLGTRAIGEHGNEESLSVENAILESKYRDKALDCMEYLVYGRVLSRTNMGMTGSAHSYQNGNGFTTTTTGKLLETGLFQYFLITQSYSGSPQTVVALIDEDTNDCYTLN